MKHLEFEDITKSCVYLQIVICHLNPIIEPEIKSVIFLENHCDFTGDFKLADLVEKSEFYVFPS